MALPPKVRARVLEILRHPTMTRPHKTALFNSFKACVHRPDTDACFKKIDDMDIDEISKGFFHEKNENWKIIDMIVKYHREHDTPPSHELMFAGISHDMHEKSPEYYKKLREIRDIMNL